MQNEEEEEQKSDSEAEAMADLCPFPSSVPLHARCRSAFPPLPSAFPFPQGEVMVQLGLRMRLGRSLTLGIADRPRGLRLSKQRTSVSISVRELRPRGLYIYKSRTKSTTITSPKNYFQARISGSQLLTSDIRRIAPPTPLAVTESKNLMC